MAFWFFDVDYSFKGTLAMGLDRLKTGYLYPTDDWGICPSDYSSKIVLYKCTWPVVYQNHLFGLSAIANIVRSDNMDSTSLLSAQYMVIFRQLWFLEE